MTDRIWMSLPHQFQRWRTRLTESGSVIELLVQAIENSSCWWLITLELVTMSGHSTVPIWDGAAAASSTLESALEQQHHCALSRSIVFDATVCAYNELTILLRSNISWIWCPHQEPRPDLHLWFMLGTLQIEAVICIVVSLWMSLWSSCMSSSGAHLPKQSRMARSDQCRQTEHYFTGKAGAVIDGPHKM